MPTRLPVRPVLARLPAMVRAVLLAMAIGAVPAAHAQSAPGDLLHNLTRKPPSGPLQAPTPAPVPVPAGPAGGPSASGGAFDASGYRQPDMMAGFFRGQPEAVKGGSEAEVRLYIIHLVGIANASCPNVDARIANAILRSRFGDALTDPDAMARMGLEQLGTILGQIANPGAMMQGAMNEAVWEGDAKADLYTFLGRYGCTEDVNVLLRGAAHYYANPPSAARKERERAQAAVLSSCNAGFDGAADYCRCAVEALAALPLTPEDWKIMAASFTNITRIRADRTQLRDTLRQCRR